MKAAMQRVVIFPAMREAAAEVLGSEAQQELAKARIGEFAACCERYRKPEESLLEAAQRLIFLHAVIEADGSQKAVARTLSLSGRVVNYWFRTYGLPYVAGAPPQKKEAAL